MRLINHSAIAFLLTIFASFGGMSSDFDLDASKSTDKYAITAGIGTTKRTELHFKVHVKKRNLRAIDHDLTAHLFVFSRHPETEREYVHFKQKFSGINLRDKNSITLDAKTFNIDNRVGMSMRDREYRGFYLSLTSPAGKVLATRTTHRHFKEMIPEELRPFENGSLLEPMEAGKPVEWKVIFRSDNPSIWNSDTNNGNDDFSVAIDKIKSNVDFIKVTCVASNSAVIYATGTIKPEDLSELSLHEGCGWNGTCRKIHRSNKSGKIYTAYQLGIVNFTKEIPYRKGTHIHQERQQGRAGYTGWGFGKTSLVYSDQIITWNNQKWPKSVIEIAIGSGDLSSKENQLLVNFPNESE